MNFTLPYDQYLTIYRYKYLALYHALRTAILDGLLPGGTRLPSTRRLAAIYDLSRGSASQVYDMLLADGYIRGESGRGTFVAEGVSAPEDGGSGGQSSSIGTEEFAGDDTETVGSRGAGGVHKGDDAETVGRGAGGERKGDDAETVGSRGGTPRAMSGGLSVADAEGRTGAAFTEGPAFSLAPWGERLLAARAGMPAGRRETVMAEGMIDFAGGGMPMEHFPYTEWRSALNAAGGRGGKRLAEQGPPQGDERLRQAIAGHLRTTRGIRAQAEQIVLFSGSMQGIVLLTQLLLAPGEAAVVEDPGFYGIRRAVELTGGRLIAGRVDGRGLQPEDWPARLLFVTPARQFPTGAVLPLERRRKLLAWAGKRNAVIIEDDYDSEFRWGGRPIEPLKALDQAGRVIYVGSFSSTMFSGLRIGYAVLPPGLAAAAAAAKALYEPQPAAQLEQRALAQFMASGGYRRHVRRMTRLYGERARAMRALLEERLGGIFEPLPGDAGLHIYARWKRTEAEFAAFRAAALVRGADFRDAARYRLAPGEPAACFAFAHLDGAKLEEGVRRLTLAWDDVQKAPGQGMMEGSQN
ncbi:PLP-dependent aminotransferase family protein [Paenibacillus sp. NFR01]|uniref:aminotransferase-like domain-containing protein n=1 Tax=Paenibacillus sp. NFR01 TaxID=1566279 RepID=UPI0008BAC6D9|nr:PLP-dependent aminotransferase family protein [Paenibacillus sp. NFR01]SEU18893.1 GntR family transcriptional regulator / MocR family aminotransferase [Paenibacillus sp. NFR01]